MNTKIKAAKLSHSNASIQSYLFERLESSQIAELRANEAPASDEIDSTVV